MSTTESIIRSRATATTFGSRRLTSILHPVSISFALVGILVTLFAAASLYRSEQKRSETRVRVKASLVDERIRHQKLAAIHIARAGGAHVAERGSVSPDGWETYCRLLGPDCRKLGILGIGFLEKAAADENVPTFEMPRFGHFSTLHYADSGLEGDVQMVPAALIGFAQAEAMSTAFHQNDSALSSAVESGDDDEDRSLAFVFHPIFDPQHSLNTENEKKEALLGFVFCQLKLDESTTSKPSDESPAGAVPASKILSEILSTPSEELRYELRETLHHSQSVKLLPLLIASSGIMFTLVGLLFLSDSRMTQERATKIAIEMAESLEVREKEVVQLNAELEGKVKERTAQLQSANEDLKAFSYTLSHDLRTPVRHIDHLATALREDCDLTPEDEATNILSRIRNSTERMDQMITDILTLAGQANTPPKLKESDLTKITKEMIEMLLETRSGKTPRIQIEEGMSAVADQTMFRATIQNLLENALKFSSTKEVPEVRCGSIPVESGRVFFVSDNGTGLKMRYAEKLYMPFKRLHRDKEIAGSGIGMATVKKAITQHGGSILCQSEVDLGTTFYFTLDRQVIIDLDEVVEASQTCEVRPIVARYDESRDDAHHSPGNMDTEKACRPLEPAR